MPNGERWGLRLLASVELDSSYGPQPEGRCAVIELVFHSSRPNQPVIVAFFRPTLFSFGYVFIPLRALNQTLKNTYGQLNFYSVVFSNRN